MRNTIKWTAAISAAALCAMAPVFSSAALAQGAGWVQENENWKYYDSDGYSLTDSWKKYGDDWYYLDEEGNMAVNRQVNEYYVDAEGKRVTDKWVSAANEDDWDETAPAQYWYYYGSNGQMTVSKFKSIDGVTYYFDDEGRMSTGLKEIEDAVYYFSGSGAMKKGWVELPAENDEFGDTTVWSYFDSRGQRIENQLDKKISGAYYSFENGVMITGWYKVPSEAAAETEAVTETSAAETEVAAETESAAEIEAAAETETAAETEAASETEPAAETEAAAAPAAGYQYYDESGKRASGWLTIAGIPGISAEDETYRFYFKSGAPYYAANGGIQIFGIGSDRYAFNDRGEMQTGLTVVTLDDGFTANYYFGDNGAMKTGRQTIFNDDTEMSQIWYFQTEGSARGQGFHGIHSNAIYDHGVRLDADSDLRYAPVTFEGQKYLVNASGTIQKASASSRSAARPDLGTGFRDVRDSNDTVWTVDANGIVQ